MSDEDSILLQWTSITITVYLGNVLIAKVRTELERAFSTVWLSISELSENVLNASQSDQRLDDDIDEITDLDDSLQCLYLISS